MPKRQPKRRISSPQKVVPPADLKRIIRAYGEMLARYYEKSGEATKAELDDLRGVKIAQPAVKPTTVSQQQIKRAVRKAVQEYSEKHSKALARS